MDKFWIRKAHKYIDEHNCFRNISEIAYNEENGSAIIDADLLVNLPSSFINTGITSIGVRAIEPVRFTFWQDFPFKAPKVILRDDFPRCLPHINPSTKEVIPCIYEGNLSDLLQQSTWMNGILNQLVDWMEKAASGSLMNYAQGWEPMRNDDPDGFTIYDIDEVLNFLKKAEIGSRGIKYEQRRGLIFTDELCDSRNVKKGTVFVCRSNTRIIDTYCPNKIVNLSNLYHYAQEVGIPGLKDSVEAYDMRCLDEDKLFIILAIKRPVNLIGSERNIELLNFVVHKSPPRKGKKRVLPECKIGMLSHISRITPTLLKKLSGSKQQLNSKLSIAILGCGSLGSKICLHLARNGNGPFLCIDNDIFLPHNNARHGLSLTWTQNKADLLKIAILDITNANADTYKDTALGYKFPGCRSIIDSTASLSVRSYLMSMNDSPPIVSCMLYDAGELGITLIEGESKQTRLCDLWARLYLLAIENALLRKFLFSGGRDAILIGQSCSSYTIAMSDAKLSLFAASMGLRIQQILEDDFPKRGKIIVSRIDDKYGLSSEMYDVGNSVDVQSLTQKDWNVRISNSVVERMNEQALHSGDNETGGCLIGSIFLAAKYIVISDILPPPPDSISTPTLFVLGTEGLESKIKTIERKSNAKVTYLGTWHSHPHGGPASDTDKNTAIRLLFVRNYEPTVCLIWVHGGLIQV